VDNAEAVLSLYRETKYCTIGQEMIRRTDELSVEIKIIKRLAIYNKTLTGLAAQSNLCATNTVKIDQVLSYVLTNLK